MIRIIVLLSALTIVAHGQECQIEETVHGQVCVCNARHCDTVPSLNVIPGHYQQYFSSKSKLGFYSKTESFTTNMKSAKNTITMDHSTTYQTIIGFGGAFTDSVGINLVALPAKARQKLMESYFSESGIGYNMVRVPIGGSDFSTRGYSYDDNLDPSLHNFTLQPEDVKYKIPFLQQAVKLTKNKLKLLGTAWTAPPWMKTNNDWTGVGLLRDEYYQTWAEYFIKFFDKYQAHNLTFWGMTTQNEPLDGFIPKSISRINAMGWTPTNMIEWVSNNLGPTLRKSTHKDVKIILHDDQRLTLPFLWEILNDKEAMNYADGVGMHWYTDIFVPPVILQTIKSPFKDVFILATEACNGYLAALGLDVPIQKGSWHRGAIYASNIMGNLENGVSGWVDWNMVLDEAGGPTYINNFVDSPVLVNSTLQEFYKQPMFYVLGHFSKFVIPGSVRVKATLSDSVRSTGVQALAFRRPDELTVLIIFNDGSSNIKIQVQHSNNKMADVSTEAYSMNTLLFR